MSRPKKYNIKNNHLLYTNDYYKSQCKTLKKTIKDSVFENAAICDEIAATQEKLLIVQEQCKFLTKKLKPFELKPGVFETQKPEKTSTKKGSSKKKTEKKEKNPDKKKPKTSVIATNNGKKKSVKRQPPKQKQKVGPNEPTVSGNVTIYNFGQIVYDTPFYYSDCAIYPPGYYATRTYAHFRNLFSRCTYHCKVIKAGSSPRFEIMDHDKHFKVTGLSTDECHSHLIALINKMLGADDLIPANQNGDRFFGLSIPTVRLKLQTKPESKFCTGYTPLKLEADYEEAELKAENDPSVSFEGLHSCLNKFC